mmetsp:Transcript_29886/g.45693  ORF Transcript_29886/g.45693 Transcript_29886/m.45693 type:complete len:100 (+) Transcript_29886:1-300(+)
MKSARDDYKARRQMAPGVNHSFVTIEDEAPTDEDIPSSEYLSFPQALSKAGKKRCDTFQKISSTAIMTGICSYDWILFGMQFFEYVNPMLCIYSPQDVS